MTAYDDWYCIDGLNTQTPSERLAALAEKGHGSQIGPLLIATYLDELVLQIALLSEAVVEIHRTLDRHSEK